MGFCDMVEIIFDLEDFYEKCSGKMVELKYVDSISHDITEISTNQCQ